MSEVILKVENLSKQYRLGTVGTGTISHDLNRWWHKVRGKEDPYLKIGETNDRSTKGASDYAWALCDINFEVKRGEVLGIIGKNGAGKSTLLKILSRVTSPTSGEIRTKGRIASLLEVGTGFHPELTGRENIYLNGAILGMTKAEIKFKEHEIIEFSGCERYIDTPVKRYSSGMRVRLAFAVAAHLEPDILVVDEVLAVGDAEFQKKAIGKMQDISRGEGRTVLFVSHDMGAVENLCTRCLILKNGQVDFSGLTGVAIKKYSEIKSIASLTNLEGQRNVENKRRYFSAVNFFYSINKEDYTESNSIPSGAKTRIDVSIVNKLIEISNMEISLRIHNSQGLSIANLSNEFTTYSLESSDKEKDVYRFEVDRLDLRSGKYYLTLWGKDSIGVFDFIEEGGLFQIIPSDYFGSGKYPKLQKHGFMLINSSQFRL